MKLGVEFTRAVIICILLECLYLLISNKFEAAEAVSIKILDVL